MRPLPAPISPERWIMQLFSAQTVAAGGIVRRQVRDVERLVGRERFLREVRRRGYRAIENGGYFVIFCNTDPVLVVT
ncbi:N-(5'-phosphoribosyl)anthranilate isomerase [Xinfangfangia sp. CPCC 101601]|uniref:N-(5'-phosphoribosyl)anthranilate isomerase n=1 Tax=Pseudogemmobacter lacusdianii TaxID=3069608 RepID=A0ABU0VTJ4_9RHOB|nr:N-(5'-phosphoribosyl)anthranilate isomerase [Xinfangfangia sp. CPCC 101601]MDQ2065056.1 N-(5'-phosphoribosyl)anthranilate isomerase [Xinfangfangia sp. CPCC 101601]